MSRRIILYVRTILVMDQEKFCSALSKHAAVAIRIRWPTGNLLGGPGHRETSAHKELSDEVAQDILKQ